jgi:hypothetical protein
MKPPSGGFFTPARDFQVPFWIGFNTGLDAGDGGGEAVGEMRRPFCPQAVNAEAKQIAATTAMLLVMTGRRFKLNLIVFID